MDYFGVTEAAARFINGVCREIAANLPYATEHRILEAQKARNEVRRAFNLLVRWRAARPFLCIGQSAYAQALVYQMIASYRRAMLHVRFPYDESLLCSMHQLLEEHPPRFDPPNAARVPPTAGLFLFIGEIN